MDLSDNNHENRRSYRKGLLFSVALQHKVVTYKNYEELSETDLINILVEINSPMLEALYQCFVKYDMLFRFLIDLKLLYPNTNDVELNEEQEIVFFRLLLEKLEASSDFNKKEKEVFGDKYSNFKSYAEITKNMKLSQN